MTPAKPKILVITPYSFGYTSLPYYWCQYLTENYDLTCLCLEDILKREPLSVRGVKVKYVRAGSSRFARYISFLIESFRSVQKGFDLCIIMYFPGCAIIRLLNPMRRKFILDIQTGPVGASKIKRAFDNWLLRAEASFFRNIIVLSESLRQKLQITSSSHVIPIGATTISDKERDFNRLDLLYVGTLQNRNIDKTIKGFAQFHAQFKAKITMSYTVIGNGFRNEEEDLKELVRETGLEGFVTIAGYVARDKLAPFLDEANIGVSFIPMTDYYDVQPPTKTFEYLLSGMPVLATNTSENRCLVNDTNGVLIADTPEAFCQGLQELYARRYEFNSEEIRAGAQVHTWEHITMRKLIPFLNSVLQGDRAKPP
jgi:glycosyltransferase involved in cell wall biosynthesis